MLLAILSAAAAAALRSRLITDTRVISMFIGLIAALAVFFLQRFVARRAEQCRHEEAARHGCVPAPRLPRKGIFGFGRLIESIRATRAGQGPQYVVKAFDDEMGKHVHTCVVPVADYELIVTRDPANVQAMLATASADWDISEHRAASWRPLFGKGVFTSRGDDWKHFRALVRPQFATDQISDLDLFERHVQQLFSAIDEYRIGRPPWQVWTRELDLQPLFYNLTLDITTEMIYGYSVHSQNPSERIELPVLPGRPSPDRKDIGTHMDAGKAWIETRGAMWKYRLLLPTREFYKHCAAVHQYADWFVQLRLQRGDGYLDGLPEYKNRFVLLHELAKATQDPAELRSQTLNILTAGRDTTAALLGWVFYFLARHERVRSELRRHVLDKFGPYNYIPSRSYTPSRPAGPHGIECKKLREFPYLNAVMNEALRVAPVVPLNERVAIRDTVLPKGGGPNGTQPIFVPAGRQVLITTYAMTRRKDIWGPDVDEFRPERWLDDGGRKFGFEFIPFGAGARQCLGQQFARLKAAYVIVRMLQRYDRIKNAEKPPNAPMQFHHTIENRSGTGVQVWLREAIE